MGDISKRLSLHELRCKCPRCIESKPHVDHTLVAMIELVGMKFEYVTGKKVIIVVDCGNRCLVHNRETKDSSEFSRHVPEFGGDAADIKVKYEKNPGGNIYIQIPPKDVYDVIDTTFLTFGGCHAYKTFTHLDAGPRRRW